MSRYDFGVIKQGDSVSATFKVQTSAGGAQDLTGATVTWTLSPSTDRATPSLTKTPSISSPATAGRCVLSIAAGELDTAGQFYHELEVILASGDSFTASDGTMIVDPAARPTT